MNVAPVITFRGIEKTEELENLVRDEIAKLEEFIGHLSSCRVSVEMPQMHLSSGSPYRVRIDMTVPPGHELVSRREPGDGEMHEKLQTVIKDAFSVARRQLIKLKEKQSGETKTHPTQGVIGIVDKLFPEQDYGFIQSIEGQDVYFHRNAVLHGDYDRIEVGTGVYFTAEMGEKGLQATTVRIEDKPGVRRAKVEE